MFSQFTAVPIGSRIQKVAASTWLVSLKSQRRGLDVVNGTGTVDPVDVGVVGQIVEVLPGEGDVDDAGQGSKVMMKGEASRQDGVPAIIVPVLDIHDGHVDGALRAGRHARRGAVLSSHALLLFYGQFLVLSILSLRRRLLLLLLLHRCSNLGAGRVINEG